MAEVLLPELLQRVHQRTYAAKSAKLAISTTLHKQHGDELAGVSRLASPTSSEQLNQAEGLPVVVCMVLVEFAGQIIC
jgi:hypothetical protein